MHKNILNVTKKEIYEIIRDSKSDTTVRIVEIQGKNIRFSEEYYKFIEKELEFPCLCESIIARYLDWMRDLTWQNYESYYFIIYDSSFFLSKDDSGKEDFFYNFTEYIFPWWEKDVLYCMVGGKTKNFKIYLVD